MTPIVTIFLTTQNEGDDIIRISHDDAYRSVNAIEYRANDVSSSYKFYLSETATMDYLSDIFKSLDRDTDPFINVQVSTVMHPSIMYDVNDLADNDVRWQLEDMILMALRTKIHRVRDE